MSQRELVLQIFKVLTGNKADTSMQLLSLLNRIGLCCVEKKVLRSGKSLPPVIMRQRSCRDDPVKNRKVFLISGLPRSHTFARNDASPLHHEAVFSTQQSHRIKTVVALLKSCYRCIISLIFSILIITKTVHGSDFSTDLFVNSNNLTFNKLKNTAIFEGEVILWFDDIVLKTSKIEIIYKQEEGRRKIDKVIIPTHLTAKKEIEQNILIADSAAYCADTGELVLIGNVYLLQQQNILKTPKLVYYTKLNKISNGGRHKIDPSK